MPRNIPNTHIDLSKFLLDYGYLVGAIRPPTVPMKTSRLRIAFNADYEFDSGYSASFLAGWNDMGLNNMRDYDMSDDQVWYSSDPKYGRDWSLEARVVSPQDSSFRWLAGATYYDQEFIRNHIEKLIL